MTFLRSALVMCLYLPSLIGGFAPVPVLAQENRSGKLRELEAPAAATASAASTAAVAAAKGAAANPPLPPPSDSARGLFARHKARLVQVRVLLNSANEQSSLGSGFVVRDDGAKGALLLTNYHVVSSLAIHPDKYRIELRPTNERTVKASLLAVDVIHDLALLRTEAAATVAATAGAAEASAWPAFDLRAEPLTQGERLYALGNPLELGFLISEGIYNGIVESRIYDQMLFSGALNSGMSGGPAIDEAGRVVGVNVATHRNGALLSFLVPIRFGRALIERAASLAPRKEWRTEIGRQLLAHQQVVTDKLFAQAAAAPATTESTQRLAATAAVTTKVTPTATVAATNVQARAGFATQTLSGRQVATLDGSLTKCWAGGLEGERPRYQRDTLHCSLRSELFVRGNLSTGGLGLRHALLRNDKLATPQFLALSRSGEVNPAWQHGERGEKTRAECRDEYVRAAAHVYRAAICVTAYRKFEGIYDFNVNLVQVDDARERAASGLSLTGFSFDNGQRIIAAFLARLQ